EHIAALHTNKRLCMMAASHKRTAAALTSKVDEQEPRFRLGSKGESVKQLFFVVLGSGFGGGARYLVAGWFIKAFGVSFPFGTIAINAIGSLLIGLIMEVGLNKNLISGVMRVVLTPWVRHCFNP